MILNRLNWGQPHSCGANVGSKQGSWLLCKHGWSLALSAPLIVHLPHTAGHFMPRLCVSQGSYKEDKAAGPTPPTTLPHCWPTGCVQWPTRRCVAGHAALRMQACGSSSTRTE